MLELASPPGPPLCCAAVSLAVHHVEVYVFRRRRSGPQVLALRRSAGRRLGGVWQPVTGSLERGETIFQAAGREVREETGLTPRRWWLLETPLLLLDRASGRPAALPRFAAEVPAGAEVVRSEEHDAHAFLGLPSAGRRFLWESQRAALAALRRQVLQGGRLARALEVPAARFTGRRRRR